MNAFPMIKFLYSNLMGSNKKGTVETVHEVITRLKFIGLIKQGEKIDTTNLIASQSTKMNSLWRWWVTEDRSDSLNFFTSTINRSFEIVQLSLYSEKSGDKKLCKIIVEDLIKCPIGMINIQDTYMKIYNDRIFWCEVQTLIQCVELKLKELRDTHPVLFPSEDDKKEEDRRGENIQSNIV